MYYIYHIPTVKIGVSEQPKQRVANQGFSDYEILEEHTDIYEVSKRERELQKEYGYRVDKHPYYMVAEWALKGGLAHDRNHFVEMQKKRTITPKVVEHGKQLAAKYNRKKRTMEYETAEYIRQQYATGKYTQERIAKCFGLHPGSISKIIRNKTYTTP